VSFAFVVEDGTGLAAANAAASVGYVDDYHASRGNAGWTAEAALAISAVDHTADTLTKAAHGFAVGDGPFCVASTVALPAGLEAGVAYWIAAIPTSGTFKLALTPDGDPVALTSNGSGTIALVPVGVKAAAIVRATDYVENRYGNALVGYKASAEQALHFPASCVYDPISGDAITGVPDAYQKAIAELALVARTSTLGGSPGAAVSSESRSAGGITRSVQYATPGAAISYPAAERWLRSLLRRPQAVRA